MLICYEDDFAVQFRLLDHPKFWVRMERHSDKLIVTDLNFDNEEREHAVEALRRGIRRYGGVPERPIVVRSVVVDYASGGGPEEAALRCDRVVAVLREALPPLVRRAMHHLVNVRDGDLDVMLCLLEAEREKAHP